MKTFILAAALALAGFAAQADTTTLSSPGLTLTSPGDTITRVNVSYDADGRVTGTFQVMDSTGLYRNVNARFDSPASAFGYAEAVNDAAGGYSVSNWGSGLVVKTSPKNLKPLPVGVDGIVVQHGPSTLPGQTPYGTRTMTTRYNSDGTCSGFCGGNNQAPAPAVQNAKSASNSGGGNYGHARK